MTINATPPGGLSKELLPHIAVVGVGRAGINAVNNLIDGSLEHVVFITAHTDAQALASARTNRRIQLGAEMTQGLGTGAKPEVGRAAAEETIDHIREQLKGSHMVFIASGMGGGTGTGAAPVIARVARDLGILTVGVVTKPFAFEGMHRSRIADRGIEELEQYVDTLIIIPNQNLFRVANEKTTFSDAFKMADEVLYSTIRCVTDLVFMPGLINLDFADIRAVMSIMGKAMVGIGEAKGERRAQDAAEAAISNPLLDDASMNGANGVLINIAGGTDMTLFEVDEVANRIRSEVDADAYIIFGSTFDDSLNGKIRVSLVSQAAQKDRPKRTRSDQLSDNFIPKQTGLATFEVGEGGLIEASAFKAPSSGDDIELLEALHPELVGVSEDLIKHLQGTNAHPYLLSLAEQYHSAIKKPLGEIKFGVLAHRGLRLQHAADSIIRTVHNSLLPGLEGHQVEALSSLIASNGPFILGTHQGRKFLEDTRAFNYQAKDAKAYINFAKEFSQSLSEADDVATVEARTFIADLNQASTSENPALPEVQLAHSSNQNFLSLVGRVAIAAVSVGGGGLIASGISSSEIGSVAVTDIAALVDASARFILANEATLLGLAVSAPETLGWINHLIDVLKMRSKG
ncbi:MAG: cell division protein FtsZ [Rhodospirillales bacterium]|nr:cell division protein FtsZ [Rhodospirillales bacterium]